MGIFTHAIRSPRQGREWRVWIFTMKASAFIVKILSEPDNSLFESLTGKLTNYPELRKRLRAILMRGETFTWLPYDEEQQQLFMYGFIRNNHNTVAISNRMFEMLLYTHFIGESDKNNDLKQIAAGMKTAFVDPDGWLDIPKIMDHFIREHNRIHGNDSEKLIRLHRDFNIHYLKNYKTD